VLTPCRDPQQNARGDIDGSFTNLRGTMENVKHHEAAWTPCFAAESARIKLAMENLDKVSATLAANSAAWTSIFANVDSLTASLADGRTGKMMANLSATSNELKGRP
jgi:ABC-type transporter Mla subunit MlaD